jgi:hypothetical protein
MRWQWRNCATSRKVAGSILDVFIEIFHWYNPSSRTMALSSNQPPTEKSTRNISERWKRTTDKLTTFCANWLEIWEPQSPGTLKASLRIAFYRELRMNYYECMIVFHPKYPARESHMGWDIINVPRPSCSFLLFLSNLTNWNWVLSADFGTITNTILEENLCLESRGLPYRQADMTEQICTCFSQQFCKHA